MGSRGGSKVGLQGGEFKRRGIIGNGGSWWHIHMSVSAREKVSSKLRRKNMGVKKEDVGNVCPMMRRRPEEKKTRLSAVGNDEELRRVDAKKEEGLTRVGGRNRIKEKREN